MRVVLVVVALLALASGCATPGITVVTMEPTALLEPAGADRLILVDAEGRASAKRVVSAMIVDAARGGYFRAEDRSGSGVKLTIAGDSASIVGGGEAAADELWMRADVLAWDADPITIEVEDDGQHHDVPGWRGRADLQFTIANAAGVVLVREYEVRGVFDIEADGDPRYVERQRDLAIGSAAHVAVSDFLTAITPYRRSQFLAFDDGDNGQSRIITDTKDTLEGLERRLRRYLEKNPKNAIAHHNLGVVLDAQGRFEEALIEHDRALDIVPREGFFDARSETMRRRTMWERMYGPRPVPQEVVDEEPAPTLPTPSSSSSSSSVTAPTPPATSTAPVDDTPITLPVGATAPPDP